MKYTPKTVGRLLKALRETGRCDLSAASAGIDLCTLHKWRREKPDFAAQWDQAYLEACEKLEAEAYRRALGWDEPVFDADGEQTGVVRRYSDTLLIFLLKGAKPARYRERLQVAGDPDAPLRIVVNRGIEPED